MTSIGWLHLSDLHWTFRRPGWTEPGVRDRVFEDLAELHDRAGPWDMIIVAGDLSMRGAPEELDQADDSLEMLMQHLRALGSRPVLLAVPGNHDICRPRDPSPSALRALRRWHDDPTARDEFWNDLASPGRRLVDRALEPFETWWKKRSPKSLRHGLLPGDFTFTLEKDGLRFGVAGLNTAFLQVTGDDYEGRLAVAPHQLTVAAGGDTPAWIARHDAAVLVTHHHPSWLAEDERARFEAEIHPAGRFAAHLSAHVHDAGPLVETGDRTRIRSPAFFGPGERPLGYVASRLLLDDDAGRLEVFPRVWSNVRMRLEAEPHAVEPVARRIGGYKILDTEVGGGAMGTVFRAGAHEAGALRTSRGSEARRQASRDAVVIPVARVRPSAEEAPGPLLERARLRDALAAIYRSPDDARRLLREAGLSAERLLLDGAAVDIWQEAVTQAEREGQLGDLVKIARMEYPKNARLADAWSAYEGARGAGSERGPDQQEQADALFERLADLPAPAFEATLSLADLTTRVPGPEAPQRTRAKNAVRTAQQRGNTARLAAAMEATGVTRGPQSQRARTPTKPSLTQLLNAMFPDERDFDGFVVSHFHDAYLRFTGSMTRAIRTRVFLDAVDPGDVVALLKRSYPSAFNYHQRVLDYEDPEERGDEDWAPRR